MDADGIVARATVVLAIAEVEALLAREPAASFSADELRYARSKRDPARRLAARLAAKRAALLLLGDGLEESDVAVRPARGGPPSLDLSTRARQALSRRGAARALVSLTHGREHAAALVVLLAA